MVQKSAPKFAADALASKAPKPMPPPLSHPLQDALLQAIAERGGVRHFPANAVLVHEDDVSDSLYILLSGRAKVYGSSSSGREVVYNTLMAGEYFGEMSLDGGPRSASVITMEPTECAVLGKADVRARMAADPDFAFELLTTAIGRAREATRVARGLALGGVYSRLAAFLEIAARPGADGARIIGDVLTQQEIASRIGSSREMVSRIMKDLETGGYIEIRARHIVLTRTLPLKW